MKSYHKRTIRRAITTIAAGAVLTATGLGWAANAQADSINDRAFIATLDEEGIAYPSKVYAIRAGQSACEELDSGIPVGYFVMELADVSALTVYEAGFFTGAAIAAYCPRHLDQVFGEGVLA